MQSESAANRLSGAHCGAPEVCSKTRDLGHFAPDRCTQRCAADSSDAARWYGFGRMAQPQTDSRFFSSPRRPSRTSAEQFARGLKAVHDRRGHRVIAITGMLVFWYAPIDADQGMRQKIFFLHVPLAIVALGGFVAGGVMAIAVPAHARQRVGPALVRRDPPLA